MNKLSILSALLFWMVFWISFYIVLSYIFDAHGIREYFSGGWFGHVWFALSVLSINVLAWFFPVYYLLLISYIRKSQRETEHRENEPYLYDSSNLLNKIKYNFKRHVESDKRQFIWHYKDTIRSSREKSKRKQENKAKSLESISKQI